MDATSAYLVSGTSSSTEENNDNLDIEISHVSRENEINEIPTGRRYFNVQHLFNQLMTFGIHAPFACNFSNMVFLREVRRGMISYFYYQCNMCHIIQKLSTEESDIKIIDINTAVASAILSIGTGYTQFNEQCSALNVPCLAKNTYQRYHENIANTMDDIALQSMLEAGKEEFQLAIENGDIDLDGVPNISVVGDGAWAKRAYKTNYNSLSGVVSSYKM